MKKSVIASFLIILILSVTLMPKTVSAQDETLPFIFRDTIYGAGIGVFIGGLVMLTTDHPSDHWDYLAVGGLVGALGGLGYGAYSSSHALVEINQDKVTVGIPSIHVDSLSGKRNQTYHTDLVKLQF